MISTNRLGFFCVLAALAVGFVAFSNRATAFVIYQENFDTNSTAFLNGLSPDVDNSGGHTWVAYGDATHTGGYKESGVLPSSSINQGAFLPFVPVANNIYTLSASFTGISTTDQANNGWYALGFGKGVPAAATLQTAENRFITAETRGRAWMLFRAGTSSNPNVINLGNAGSGTQSQANWAAGTPTAGGNMDLKIVLDTTPATFWKATFYAQRPGDPDTLASAGALTLLLNPADIGSIGIARTTATAGVLSGNITTFKLESADAPIVLGDVNGDQVVDDVDFGIIRDHLFLTGNRAFGDLTNDGIVDFGDFRQWKTAHGGGSGSSVDLAGAVPEPASGALAIIAASVGIFAGRRRRALRNL